MVNNALRSGALKKEFRKTPPATSKPTNTNSARSSKSSSSSSSSKLNLDQVFNSLNKQAFGDSYDQSKVIKSSGSVRKSRDTIIQKSDLKKVAEYAKKGYSLFDNTLFGGFLPFGDTPTNVRTTRLQRKYEDTQALNDVKILQQEQENKFKEQEYLLRLDNALTEAKTTSQLDLLDTSWFENLGIGISPQEQLLQKSLQAESLGVITPNISESALNQAVLQQQQEDDGFFGKLGDATSSGIKWSIPIIAGVALLTIFKK